MDMAQVTTIAGYRVVRPLGQGGFARVFLGESSDGHQVAIKVLDGPTANAVASYAYESLKREAEKLASVDHPNIVRIVSHGSDPPHIVMEYVEGEPLQSMLGSAILISRALVIISQLVDAVECLHSLQVVHRDLKPSNVVVDSAGNVKLVDFGLAIGTSDERLTTTIIGTPRYLAPEVVDARTPPSTAQDVYSLGVLLGEVFSRQLASSKDLQIPPTGLDIADDSVPTVLRELIKTMTRRDPSKRPTMAQVGARVRSVRPPGDATERVSDRYTPANRTRIGGLAVAALLVSCLSLMMWFRAEARIYQLEERLRVVIEKGDALRLSVEGVAEETRRHQQRDDAVQLKLSDLGETVAASKVLIDTVQKAIDVDSDGVEDWKDRCPTTKPGKIVERREVGLIGCTLEEAVADLDLEWSHIHDHENEAVRKVESPSGRRYKCRFTRVGDTGRFSISDCQW